MPPKVSKVQPAKAGNNAAKAANGPKSAAASEKNGPKSGKSRAGTAAKGKFE